MEKLQQSAKLWANSFVDAFHRLPKIEEMNAYRWMFFEKTDENMEKYYKNDPYYEDYKKLPKMYESVEELMGEQNSKES